MDSTTFQTGEVFVKGNLWVSSGSLPLEALIAWGSLAVSACSLFPFRWSAVLPRDSKEEQKRFDQVHEWVASEQKKKDYLNKDGESCLLDSVPGWDCIAPNHVDRGRSSSSILLDCVTEPVPVPIIMLLLVETSAFFLLEASWKSTKQINLSYR